MMCVCLLPAFAACVQEDDFCDATACFTCDGISCRTVEPPSRITGCVGDFQCPSGTLCTSAGCVSTCDSTAGEDGACEAGTVCRSGEDLCLAPQEDTPTRIPGDCEGPDDCPGSNLVCLDGFCAADPNACLADADCRGSEVCVSGRCETEDDVCKFSFECGVGLVCVNARCVASCDGGCATGLVCDTVDNFCKEDPAPGDCVKNDMCEAGEVCINTRCVFQCSTDSECATGDYCDDGDCRFDDRPAPPFCEQDSECATGRRCVSGVCRTPCTQDADCPAFDEQLRVCRENLCLTTNQATSDCDTQSDCDTGESCVDGICT